MTDRPTAETVLDVLGDESTRRVFGHLNSPVSAQSVADASGIPLSTVYRALDRLEDADLAERQIVIRDDGNRVFRFVRSTDRLDLTVEDGDIELLTDVPAAEAATVP
ncbi:MAG: helix-turn-helix domain-containing protein, partial [Halobaculum sp.]